MQGSLSFDGGIPGTVGEEGTAWGERNRGVRRRTTRTVEDTAPHPPADGRAHAGMLLSQEQEQGSDALQCEAALRTSHSVT